ncbi:MAG: DAK2 domain-containing protein, partial [Lentisphaerae bacterium]|nr:DAK2 domain-containing protein [Lentisphaerota bacterium]
SAGAVIGDRAENYDTVLAAKAVSAAANRMMELGGAKPGDKTMLDALLPFASALSSSAERGEALGDAWEKAAAAAQQAAEDTKDLLPKIGRARPQAERSLGTPDAGAVSLTMCMKAALKRSL